MGRKQIELSEKDSHNLEGLREYIKNGNFKMIRISREIGVSDDTLKNIYLERYNPSRSTMDKINKYVEEKVCMV